MYKHIVSYSIFIITFSAHGAYGQDQALLLPFFLPPFFKQFFFKTKITDLEIS